MPGVYTVRMEPQPAYAIEIEVATPYLPEESRPEEDLYHFAYTIGIRNTGRVAAQLISRRWLLVDAAGVRREVVGEGVVGEQPQLRPGERFEYTSSAYFHTPWGTMEGAYTMRAADGTDFIAPIPQFLLSQPRMLH